MSNILPSVIFELFNTDKYYFDFFLFSNLQIYDPVTVFISTCNTWLNLDSNVLTTKSNVLMVDFVTDNVYTRTGFRLEYKQGLYQLYLP